MAPERVSIEMFDTDGASEDQLRERYDLHAAVERELEPDDAVAPFEQWVREVREAPAWRKTLRWSARDDRGRLVGYAHLGLQYTETNRHLARFFVGVSAECRRHRVALRLLEPVVRAAAEDGRTVLGANATEGGPGEHFLNAVGMEKRLVERRSRLLVHDVDPALLRSWVDAATVNAAEYSLLVWESTTPDEHLDAFVELEHVMNTAPRDDLEMEDWVNTPERYRDNEQRAFGQGYRWWTMVARHDPTGDLAGFTTIIFTPYEHDIAWQEGTGVRPAHRNHGLGRWLKAAMLEKLRSERPDVWRVDTWNAGSNKTMLGINVALGFHPVKHYGAFQAPTGKLAAAVGERTG